MNYQEILESVRKEIRVYAGDDPDKLFYANRYVFARLQLDERKTKTKIKKKLFDSNRPCHYCNKSFDSHKGIHLHRLEGSRGYSHDNCALMHSDCHIQYHAENPSSKSSGQSPLHPEAGADQVVLVKKSKRYEDESFLYWWDIAPEFLEKLDDYDDVEFVQKDTGDS